MRSDTSLPLTPAQQTTHLIALEVLQGPGISPSHHPDYSAGPLLGWPVPFLVCCNLLAIGESVSVQPIPRHRKCSPSLPKVQDAYIAMFCFTPYQLMPHLPVHLKAAATWEHCPAHHLCSPAWLWGLSNKREAS